MIRKLLYILYIIGVFSPLSSWGQINTDRVMTIGRNALYFEDYVLSIQYFNQVINAKPYLAEPYFYRGLAKMNLDDYQGAEMIVPRLLSVILSYLMHIRYEVFLVFVRRNLKRPFRTMRKL